MNPPSLFELSLLPFSLKETLEICSSRQFPPCTEVWKVKAEKNLKIPRQFFDLYLGSDLSSPRPIVESYRYLELAVINSFLPESAVSRDRKTGQITGIFESFAGVKDAIIRGDEQEFEFFFARLKPEAKSKLIQILNSQFLLPELFPQGPDAISIHIFGILYRRLVEDVPFDQFGPYITGTQFWLAGIEPSNDISDWDYREEVREKIQKRYLADSSRTQQIIESPADYFFETFLPLVEKGDQRALQYFLDNFSKGIANYLTEQVFIAILRSGRVDFLDAFSPYLRKIGLKWGLTLPSQTASIEDSSRTPDLSTNYFVAAAYGGNSKMVEFLSLIRGETPAEIVTKGNYSFANRYVRSAVDGFFSHRNVLGTYDLIQPIPFNSWTTDLVALSGLPIDILDLLYHKFPIVEDSPSRTWFLGKILSQNLGYLNVVFYCLAQLETQIRNENFFEYLIVTTIPEPIFTDGKILTPLSVSIIESAIESWKASVLPPLVENN